MAGSDATSNAPEASADAAPGLRERKNRRTRLAIVRATSELTIEESYAAATIPRIAERADVAPRTVSTWFPSKDDILFEGADDTIQRGVDHLHSGEGDVVDRLLAWFEDEGARRDTDHEMAPLRNAAIQHDPELRARYRQLFARFQTEIGRAAAEATGAAPDSMGPLVFAGAAVAFLEHLAALTLTATDRGEPSDEARHGFETGLEFLRAGLASITP